MQPPSIRLRGGCTLAAIGTERVLNIQHWTDTQFTFATTRDSGLRFENGQFVMVGLTIDSRPLLRAYSIASANHEEHLRVPEHQGTRRPADLAPAAHPRGR